jgi:hypothetical protein
MKNGIHDAVASLLNVKLKTFTGRSLDRTTCSEIYEKIFETLTDLFVEVKAPIDNEAANYIAQAYYDGILIQDKHELDPNIFDRRAKLENIPTNQLVVMAVMLENTDHKLPIVAEIKKRS